MSNWRPELSNLPGSRYGAIVQALQLSIQNGELLPGQRLPTHRDLAAALGVSIQTVARAYTEAERQGLVKGEVGRGTFICYARPQKHAISRADTVSLHIIETEEGQVFNFSTLIPVVGEMHHELIRRVFLEIGGTGDVNPFLAGQPIAGLQRHREGAVQWLARQGVTVSADRVLVTNGVAQATWAAMASLARSGDVLATAQYVDSGVITNASILNLRQIGLELDEEGILPASLEAACQSHRVKLLYMTPVYNIPTASLMSEGRCKQIAEIVHRYGLSVIEDDAYGPLVPDRPRPFWTYAPDRTCYITSFSRIVPGLRTGYLVGPEGLMSRLISRFRATSWMANTWTAEVATRWIESGTATELVDWQRAAIHERQEAAAEALRGAEYVSHPYCQHLWLSLPGTWRARAFTRQAAERGVLVTPPDPFLVGRVIEPHAVRISIGGTLQSAAVVREGLSILNSLLAEGPDPIGMMY